MPRSTWRDRIAPVVAEIIEQTGKADMQTLRAALRERKPSQSWLMKVWCSEVRRQLGLPLHPRKQKQAEEAERKRGQKRMFE
jgi:hypothetical protein